MPRITEHESTPNRADEPFAAWKLPELEGVDDLSARVFRAFLATAAPALTNS